MFNTDLRVWNFIQGDGVIPADFTHCLKVEGMQPWRSLSGTMNYGALDYVPVLKRANEYLDMDLGIMLSWGSDSFLSLSYIEMKLKHKYKMGFILLLKS